MLRSEHKKTATRAISSAFANLLNGIRSDNDVISSFDKVECVNSVSVKPGQSAFTRILWEAKSRAAVLVNPISPVLLAE